MRQSFYFWVYVVLVLILMGHGVPNTVLCIWSYASFLKNWEKTQKNLQFKGIIQSFSISSLSKRICRIYEITPLIVLLTERTKELKAVDSNLTCNGSLRTVVKPCQSLGRSQDDRHERFQITNFKSVLRWRNYVLKLGQWRTFLKLLVGFFFLLVETLMSFASTLVL